MAYQNVGTPRFYIDQVNWQMAVGIDLNTSFDSIPNDTPIAGLKTPHITEISTNAVGNHATYNIGMIDENNNWCAILGHNLETANALFYLEYYDGDYVGIYNDVALVNNNQYDGFQLWINGSGGDYFNPSREPSSHCRFVFKSKNSDYSWDTATFKIGSLCFGTYYDMPNAPNLSLTMSREYGGTKEFTTHNGSSMSNTMWSKPPKWGDLGAWELGGDSNPALSRSGRRSWDLKFSFMADSDLWGSNQSLSFLDVANNTTFDHNLLTDDNFFSQVWHKTLGGTLPFIFQPDGGANGNNNPDQFCIAKFKDNSLKATQSAFNVYDISLSIEEVW